MLKDFKIILKKEKTLQEHHPSVNTQEQGLDYFTVILLYPSPHKDGNIYFS